jgi:L-fuconolactonase
MSTLKSIRKVDAHQHYWKVDRGDYGWLTSETGVLYRDYLPADLKPLLAECGISHSIAVQAAPTVAETEFLLSLCEEEPTLAGVVGWLDLEADDFPAQFIRLRRNPYFVGLRPMLQDLEDDAYILRPKVVESLKLLASHEFPLDLLVYPRHLPYVLQLIDKLPELRAVIDHAAKPNIAGSVLEPWRGLMKDIAAHPNIYCKLSGMVTEADHHRWRLEHFIPYVHHVLECFGTSRVMFGSDWPVCLLAAGYGDVYRLLQEAVPSGLSETEAGRLFGGNALEFYRLG